MRSEYEKNPAMSEEQARELLIRCLKVMYYRDARSLNRVGSLSLAACGDQLIDAASHIHSRSAGSSLTPHAPPCHSTKLQCQLIRG